ncbi:MAG: hypothetical protein EBV30_05545, partial [Actinobacteria bacterium]|nr:hypothetical protein [Actinomycetota bacterium]
MGNFANAFKNIYGMELTTFYTLAAEHVEDTVGDLLGIPTKSTSTSSTSASASSGTSSGSGKADPVIVTPTEGTPNSVAIISAVKETIAQSKTVATSPLIHVLIEPGAMTADQEKWLTDSLQ